MVGALVGLLGGVSLSAPLIFRLLPFTEAFLLGFLARPASLAVRLALFETVPIRLFSRRLPPLLGRLVVAAASFLGLVPLTEALLLGGLVDRGHVPARFFRHVMSVPARCVHDGEAGAVAGVAVAGALELHADCQVPAAPGGAGIPDGTEWRRVVSIGGEAYRPSLPPRR